MDRHGAGLRNRPGARPSGSVGRKDGVHEGRGTACGAIIRARAGCGDCAAQGRAGQPVRHVDADDPELSIPGRPVLVELDRALARPLVPPQREDTDQRERRRIGRQRPGQQGAVRTGLAARPLVLIDDDVMDRDILDIGPDFLDGLQPELIVSTPPGSNRTLLPRRTASERSWSQPLHNEAAPARPTR